MIPQIPKPDFTNIGLINVAIDETPKVPQKGLVIAEDDSTDDNLTKKIPIKKD